MFLSYNVNSALEIAKKWANGYGLKYFGTEHVVYGILCVKGVASDILQKCGVTTDRYVELYRHAIDRSRTFSTDKTINLTRALNYASQLGAKEKQSFVGTEHLLYALISNSDYGAYELLSRIVDIPKMRDDLYKLIFPEAVEPKEEIAGEFHRDVMPQEGKGYGWSGGIDSALLEYGEDLTQKALDGKLDPVIGRSAEIEKVIQVLSRRTKNNPVLVGEPGVGKSAVIEGLAQAIVAGDVPDLLRDKAVFSLNLTGLLAGTRYRGDFEERLKRLVDVITRDKKIILFIDEIHMLVGAGSTTDGSMDASNILKPMLARGELQTVGATTYEEYRKFIEKDAALERRFTPVAVEQPGVSDTIEILKGLREKYEMHHNVVIRDDAIEAAAKLSDRYITDRFLPDKAIDLIDEAASKERLRAYNGPKVLRDLEEKYDRACYEWDSAKRWSNYSGAETAKTEELFAHKQELEKQLLAAQEEWKAQRHGMQPSIGAEEVAEIVSNWTGIPVSRLTETESERLMHLEEELHRRIVGQNEAVSTVSKAIRRARAGLKSPGKPIGSFIFVGPTGVGKTDLAKALAESLFGDERLMIRLDMSEFMEKHSVTKMIGAPPGYVGYDDGRGSLTERVRQKPYSVILFDEIEKAHPDIFNVLLQILDDGRLTDNKGRIISFKNTIIILTSNIGAHEVKDVASLGFGTEEAKNEYRDMKERIDDALKKHFRPEFLNRIDDIIAFHKLSKEDADCICEKMLDALNEQLKDRKIRLRVTARARSLLVDEGYSEEFGARPLKRIIRRLIEDRLSEEILRGRIVSGDTIVVDEENKKFVFMLT